MSKSDKIEKQIMLRAPRARVWRALTNAEEFSSWFCCKLEGAFAEGATVRGQITSPGYEHLILQMQIERMESGRLFSYRWHPYPSERGRDYSDEPTTLVELRLEDAPGGTLLTVVESGFDRLPPERRQLAFRANEPGWVEQLENIERYVAQG